MVTRKSYKNHDCLDELLKALANKEKEAEKEDNDYIDYALDKIESGTAEYKVRL